MKNIVIVGTILPFAGSKQTVFSRGNVRIIPVASGAEALATCRDEEVALLVTELNLHDIPGDELWGKARAESRNPRISVLIVCRDAQDDVDRCIRAGATDYATDVATLDELLSKTAHLLGVAERRDYRVLAKISASGRIGQYGDVPFFGVIKDISTSGMLLETGKTFAVGEHLSCSFYLDSQSITVNGSVRRVSNDLCGNQYGIQFGDLDDDAREAIAGFVNARSPASN